MIRRFASPSNYLQGPGALDALPEMVPVTGAPPVLLVDPLVHELLGSRLVGLLPTAEVLFLDADVTDSAVAELSARHDGPAPSVVIGVGGGKALDTAKALSVLWQRPVITVPTAASNDSATSRLVAMYDGQHVLARVDSMASNPLAVVVDTALITAAPAALLRAGIGDAVAKAAEARGCALGTGSTPLGTRPLRLGAQIAQSCFSTLLQDAESALAATADRRVTPELENVVEAVILMSGLGFENGGLSLAHALTRGLMAARGAGTALHGEQVAWGLLVQLALEGRADERVVVTSFLERVGLPTRLSALGMTEPTAAEISAIARAAMAAPHMSNLADPATLADLVSAIDMVED